MSDEKSDNYNEQNQDQIWNGYQHALNTWKTSLDSWQKAGEAALEKYIKVVNQASKQSNFDLLKKFSEEWAKTWNEIAEQSSQWHFRTWEKIWKESNFVSYNVFNEYWQNMWKDSTDKAFKQFKETLEQLGKGWQKNKES